MIKQNTTNGFSLVEVIMAVAIFGVAVAGILALLPSLAKQAGESGDELAAQRLAGPVRVELGRLAGAGFDSLAGALPVMGAPLQNGLALVAARDGLRVHSVSYLPPATGAQIPQSEQYFLVEVWRFNTAPLSYSASSAVLATYVRISWPYYNPGTTTATPLADRNQLAYPIALNR